MLSVHMLSQFPPSVYLSVTQVDQSKMVEVRIMQFSLYSSPIPLVFAGKFHPEILTGYPERGRQTRVGWEKQLFSSFMHQYLENGTRYVQSYY